MFFSYIKSLLKKHFYSLIIYIKSGSTFRTATILYHQNMDVLTVL